MYLEIEYKTNDGEEDLYGFGGSVISTKHVLTVAHAFYEKDKRGLRDE